MRRNRVYNRLGIKPENIVWIDAIPLKVIQATNRGIPYVYHAVITDKDDEDVVFNVSNNVQSSSVLEFGTHSQEHPSVVYIDKINLKSITIDTFLKETILTRLNLILEFRYSRGRIYGIKRCYSFDSICESNIFRS